MGGWFVSVELVGSCGRVGGKKLQLHHLLESVRGGRLRIRSCCKYSMFIPLLYRDSKLESLWWHAVPGVEFRLGVWGGG